MAVPTDPTDPTTTDPSVIAAQTAAVEDNTAAWQENADAGRAVSDVTASVQRQMSSITNVIDNVGSALNSFTDSYSNAATNLQNGLFTENDARNISLVTTALIGTQNTLQQFSGLNIRSDGILAPLENMKKALNEGGGLLDKMADNVLSAFGKIMPDSVKTSSAAIVNFGINLLKSADNAIHMRDAVIKLSAASGGLDRLFAASGPNLENINELIGQQSEQISGVAQTMNISREDAVRYYTEIGKIPGALTATIPASQELFKGMDDSIASSSGQVDLFTGALAVAKGTGRDFEDIVKDLNTAFKDYGLTGKDALNFSVNMSEISNNLGIDLQSVQSALSGGAQAFREFADAGASSAQMAEGLARLTNEYAQSLRNQGLSGNVALEVAQNMTNEIGKLSIAQKSFISAQSGGPGGLIGAFQIEKDLREGKIENVFKKVRDVMQKQLGNIVSLDDATKSPAAAAQLARQVTMLRSGPLGQFARTDQEAYRVLEAFKSGDRGIRQLAPDALKNAMDKGVILQDQSRTFLSEIRSNSERQLALTDQTNLLLAQQLTAATGTRRGPDTLSQEAYRDFLKSSRSVAAERSEQLAERTRTAIGSSTRPGAGVNLQVDTTIEGLTQNTGKVAGQLISGKNKIVEIIQDKAQREIDSILNKLNTETNPDVKASLQKTANELTQTAGIIKQGTLINARPEVTTPGATLGGAVTAAISTPSPTTVPPANGTTNAFAARSISYANPTTGTLGDINVHVTGYCVKCKQEIEGGDQVSALSPAARRTSP